MLSLIIRSKSPAIGSIRHAATSTSSVTSQIYAHGLDGVPRYKFSLLKDPKFLGLGYSREPRISDPGLFETNLRYVDLLQKVITDKIQHDFTFIVEAGMNPSTHMPIYDLREVPNYARIPEIENIYGYIQVDSKGKMIPGSYQENNMYRLCTGKSGLSKLSDYLHEEMIKECQNVSE